VIFATNLDIQTTKILIQHKSIAAKGNVIYFLFPQTNAGRGPRFSCSLERNNTTAKRKKFLNWSRVLPNLFFNSQKLASQECSEVSYHNFHHYSNANNAHREDAEGEIFYHLICEIFRLNFCHFLYPFVRRNSVMP
jgi:hypothetical protein